MTKTILIIFLSILWGAPLFAKKVEYEPSCGLMLSKDESWIKKPMKIPLEAASAKGTNGFLLYDKDSLTVGLVRTKDHTAVSASKGKTVIAVLVIPALTSPLQLALGDTGIELLCNTAEPLLTMHLPGH